MTARGAHFIVACLALAPCGCSQPEGASGTGEHARDEHHRSGSHPSGAGQHHRQRARQGHVIHLSPAMLKQSKLHTAVVAARQMAGVIESTGEVAFDQDRLAHVSPRAPGRVHKVRAKLGAHVKRAQTMTLLDSIELGKAKADFLRARAQLKLARQNRQREEKLLEERITSMRDVISARAAHDKALADYRAARQTLRLLGLSSGQVENMRYSERGAALLAVRSPIQGRVIKKHVTLGELVTPKDTLYVVADLSQLWIWIDVYERDLANVHLDDTVEVRVKAYPRRVFSGKVTYIGDEIDRDTRAVRARLDVENPDRALKPGMFARVRLSDPHAKGGKTHKREVLAVPAKAIQRDGARSLAFVQLAKGRYRAQPVTLGTTDGEHVEIRSGLKRGDRVVTDGAFLLKSEAAKHRMGGGHHH